MFALNAFIDEDGAIQRTEDAMVRVRIRSRTRKVMVRVRKGYGEG